MQHLIESFILVNDMRYSLLAHSG